MGNFRSKSSGEKLSDKGLFCRSRDRSRLPAVIAEGPLGDTAIARTRLEGARQRWFDLPTWERGWQDRGLGLGVI